VYVDVLFPSYKRRKTMNILVQQNQFSVVSFNIKAKCESTYYNQTVKRTQVTYSYTAV